MVWAITPVPLITGTNNASAVSRAMLSARVGSPLAMARRAASTNSGCDRPTWAMERANASTLGGREAGALASADMGGTLSARPVGRRSELPGAG